MKKCLLFYAFLSIISVFYCSSNVDFSGQNVLDWEKLRYLNILVSSLVIVVQFYSE